jgi:uncharacterized protein YbjT (DUF2867 family)
VPVMRLQPIAAREVADRLVSLVLGPPRGQVPDLAGPREELLVDMVRSYARAVQSRIPVIQIGVPGALGTAMRAGALLPSPLAERGSQSFREWVDSAAHATATG